MCKISHALLRSRAILSFLRFSTRMNRLFVVFHTFVFRQISIKKKKKMVEIFDIWLDIGHVIGQERRFTGASYKITF